MEPTPDPSIERTAAGKPVSAAHVKRQAHEGERVDMARYDTIGRDYNIHRNADMRVASMLKKLLALPPGSVLADIGAGTGNYSNAMTTYGYKVKAIEPSEEMRRQAVGNEQVEYIGGRAEAIPLESDSVDGVFSTLAIHHFSSLRNAASEMRRICPYGPIVLFTNDPRKGESFWLADYFPKAFKGLFASYPPVEEITQLVASVGGWASMVFCFPLPSDFSDLNTRSGWNRPEIYLDPIARKSMSVFALASGTEIKLGVERLRQDIESGVWDEKYGYLRRKESLDLGFVFLRFQGPTPGQERSL